VYVICKDEVLAEYENGAYRTGLNGGSFYTCAHFFKGSTRLCYPNIQERNKGQARWVAAPAPTNQRRWDVTGIIGMMLVSISVSIYITFHRSTTR
jgi:hypothetical protein